MCVSIFLVMLHTMVVRVRRPIGFRPPSDQIPFAARPDFVRRPIRFRSPSDRIPSAARSDSVRRPIGFRPPSDQIAFAVRPSTYACKSS